MERIDTAVIDKIRDGLINRYDKDQQMQQLIEEIGAEEGLNEQELAIVYQAYLEVKERMQYTANLVELWNQIETVQQRMDLLHTYDSLESDLLGEDSVDNESSIHNGGYNPMSHGDAKPLGYGAGKAKDLNYTMDRVELHEVEPVTMNTVFDSMNNVDEENSLHGVIGDDAKLLDEDEFDDAHVDESKTTHLDPYDLMTAMFAEEAKQSKKLSKDKKAAKKESKEAKKEAKEAKKEAKHKKSKSFDDAIVSDDKGSKKDKHSADRSKEQKKIDKLLKKQMKRIEKEWAKISGKLDKDEKKSKSKEDKSGKKKKS